MNKRGGYSGERIHQPRIPSDEISRQGVLRVEKARLLVQLEPIGVPGVECLDLELVIEMVGEEVSQQCICHNIKGIIPPRHPQAGIEAQEFLRLPAFFAVLNRPTSAVCAPEPPVLT